METRTIRQSRIRRTRRQVAHLSDRIQIAACRRITPPSLSRSGSASCARPGSWSGRSPKPAYRLEVTTGRRSTSRRYGSRSGQRPVLRKGTPVWSPDRPRRLPIRIGTTIDPAPPLATIASGPSCLGRAGIRDDGGPPGSSAEARSPLGSADRPRFPSTRMVDMIGQVTGGGSSQAEPYTSLP